MRPAAAPKDAGRTPKRCQIHLDARGFFEGADFAPNFFAAHLNTYRDCGNMTSGVVKCGQSTGLATPQLIPSSITANNPKATPDKLSQFMRSPKNSRWAAATSTRDPPVATGNTTLPGRPVSNAVAIATWAPTLPRAIKAPRPTSFRCNWNPLPNMGTPRVKMPAPYQRAK